MKKKDVLALFLLGLFGSKLLFGQVTLPNGNADLGLQINAAVASLPASGGKIIVQTAANGGCYVFTTPVVVTKAVIVEGLGPSTCLNFQGTGTAITFHGNGVSFVNDSFPDGFGLRDLTLRGSGGQGAQTAIALGGTDDSVGFYGSGLTITNFALGLQFLHGVWNFKIEHSTFGPNAQNVRWNSALHFGGENLDFDSVTFVGATFANSVEFNDSSTDFSNLNSLTFVSCNFDSAQLVINNGAGSVRLYAPHFENAGLGSGTEPFVRIAAYTAATDVVMDGPDFYNDQSNPYPPSFIELDGGPAVTISQMRSVNLDGTANVPANLMIAGDAFVTLLGDAPLRGAQQQYVVASGNPKLWVMGGQDPNERVQSPTPILYSQTAGYSNAQSPIVQIGGNDSSPTVGFNLWSGVGSSYYGAEIKQTGTSELDFCFAGSSVLGNGKYVCNAGIVNGVFRSAVPDGTAPLSVTSHTPPDNLNAWPATFSASGGQIQNPHITSGKYILPFGGQGVVTFQGAAQFTQTPTCTVSYQTGGPFPAARALSSDPSPGQIVIFGQPYVGVYYMCVGN